jgi:hypothetical protein
VCVIPAIIFESACSCAVAALCNPVDWGVPPMMPPTCVTLLGLIASCALSVYAARIEPHPRLREAVPTTSTVYIKAVQQNGPRDGMVLLPSSSSSCRGGTSLGWKRQCSSQQQAAVTVPVVACRVGRQAGSLRSLFSCWCPRQQLRTTTGVHQPGLHQHAADEGSRLC